MATSQTVKEALGGAPADTEQHGDGMSTDLAVREDQAPDIARGVMRDTSIDARIRYARELAHAGLLPAAFRKQPANVLYAVEYGNMLGIHPLAAITGVHVMDGKPSASSALMGALVRRSGHRLRVRVTGTVEGGDLTAIAEIIRADDPDFTYSASWTLDRARRAGLIDALLVDEQGRTIVKARTPNGKPSSWEKFPEAMTKARAISEVAREACEEALCGVHYTPEELGANVDEDENVITGEIVSETEGAAPVEDVDWVALATAAPDTDGVREVWRRASEARALTTELRDELNRIAVEKQTAPAGDAADETADDAPAPEDAQPPLPEPCPVNGCVDPTSHPRGKHAAWVRARRQAEQDGGQEQPESSESD